MADRTAYDKKNSALTEAQRLCEEHLKSFPALQAKKSSKLPSNTKVGKFKNIEKVKKVKVVRKKF